MSKLTPEQKAQRSRQRMIDHARTKQLGTYTGIVAADFQRMIRAEAAAEPEGYATVIFEGVLVEGIFRRVGQCVCVTCGKIAPWKGNGPWTENKMHTGHFLAGRRNSILFEEENVAPQCNYCNYNRDGEQQLFRKWMLAVRGAEVVERLERLKNEVRCFTREELVDMRISYAARLKAAEERMKCEL